MSINDSKGKTELKCIFCGKTLAADEAVRYRGALSCTECASKQKPVDQFNETPFYLTAATGCILGLTIALYALVHTLKFANVGPAFYYPPLDLYFAAFMVSVPLQTIGFYALNRMDLRRLAIVIVVVGIVTIAALGWSLYDFVFAGPSYRLEGTFTIMPKGYNYYPTAGGLLFLFHLAAGSSVLLSLGRKKVENLAIATGALYLLGGGLAVFSYLVPPVAFLHAFMYAVAFIFFFTREDTKEKEPVETVRYQAVKLGD